MHIGTMERKPIEPALTGDYRIRTHVDAGSLPHDLLQQTLRYWNMRRGDRAMPSRADIDPRDIPYLLSRLMIVDRGADGTHAFIRLAGTRVVEKFSFDPTGRDLYDRPDMESLCVLCRSTATCAAPLYIEGELAWSAIVHRPYGAICLPLSENGINVDKLLISFHFPDWQEAEDGLGDQAARQNS